MPKRTHRLVLPASFLAASLMVGAPLRAQSATLTEEIEFVQGVAEELRFVELAQFEVRRLRKEYKDSLDVRRLAQLAVEVSIQGAKVHPDRATRRRLFKQALERSTNLIQRYEGQEVARRSRRSLVESCYEFGLFLNDELEIAREAGATDAKITDLETTAANVFRKGVAAAQIVQDQLVDGDEPIQGYVAWMQRGILLREHARAVPKDRAYLADQAVEVLENLILEVGEETALGQRALFEMAKIAEVCGDFDDAIDSYTDAIDAIWIALTGMSSSALPEAVQRLMFDMMQEVYDSLARVCLREGMHDRIDALVAQVNERIAEFRTEPHPVFGDSLALTQAWAHSNSADESDVTDALRTARAINERHPHDIIGLRAKNLIRDILRASSDLVTGDLLFEIAKGDYQAKDYDRAVATLKRALRRMNPEAKSALGFEAWNLLARSNEKMRRYLEAAMAYSRALDEHGNDVQRHGADALRRAANRAAYCLRRATGRASVAAFTDLEQHIGQQLARFNPAVAVARDYDAALQAKSEGKYAQAAEMFFRIDQAYDRHELAMAHGILCLYYADRYDDAMRAIERLRQHVREHALPENDRVARGYRPQALAWAHYAEGRIRYAQATGKSARPDSTQFKALVRHFRDFETTHGGHADNLMTVVHELLGRLHLELGDDTLAIARYERLKALGKTAPNTHRALGIALFSEFTDRIDLLEKELAALERKGQATIATESQLAAARKQTLAFGLDYAKTVQPPTYPLLYNLMRIAEDLEDWQPCEWAAEKILKLYKDATRSSLDQVRPVLGHALLRQSGRFREALDVLAAAEKQWKDEESRTSAYYEVLRYKAMALGGWPQFDADNIDYAPNPGLGKPDEAYDILWGKEYRKYALNSKRTPKYSLDWYRYYLQLYYVSRKAQRLDSKFRQRAETFYNIAASTDDFATLRRLGSRGVRTANLFRRIRR